MSVNRVFIFHETSDNFRAADFAGTLLTGENWDPSLTTIRGAAADAAGNIFVLDLSVNPAIVRRYDASQARQVTLDITMNNTGAYEGIAVTDSHLVALRGEGLQYYDLTTRAYVSSMDASLPSLTSPEYYVGICRAGDFLYLVTHNDSTYQPRIYKRNLDGTAVSDWAGQASTTALTIFATLDRVVTVRKNGGHWDRWRFDGTQDTTLNTIGSGLWQASYTTYEQLSIEAIDEQFIPVLTEDYELEIDIGGEPERAYVDGDMEGFYHTWDPENAKIRIKSEQVTRLISAAVWNVHLVKGMKTLDAQIIYNVVPSAPVIADPGAQKLYRGYRFSLDIDIANRPTIARGSGLLAGLKYGPREDGEDGLNIAGRLPKDANLTEAAFNAALYAENSGGADNLGVPFDIEDIDVYGIKLSPTAALHRIRLNNPDEDVTSVASATLDPSSTLYSFAADTDYFYIATHGGNIWRISRTFTDGGHIVLGTRWLLLGSRLIRGIAVDGDKIYVVDTRSGRSYKGIVVLNRSDGSSDRNFGFPSEIGLPRGIVVRGNSLIVLDNGDNALYWLDKNTARSQRAPITKTVNLPSREYREIAILSDVIFISDSRSDKIHEVSADLADGTTISEFDVSYDVPSAMQNLGAITVA